jgi:hypothetical protein
MTMAAAEEDASISNSFNKLVLDDHTPEKGHTPKKGRNPDRKRHGARNQHKMKSFTLWLLETFPDVASESRLRQQRRRQRRLPFWTLPVAKASLPLDYVCVIYYRSSW